MVKKVTLVALVVLVAPVALVAIVALVFWFVIIVIMSMMTIQHSNLLGQVHILKSEFRTVVHFLVLPPLATVRRSSSTMYLLNRKKTGCTLILSDLSSPIVRNAATLCCNYPLVYSSVRTKKGFLVG